MGLVRTPSGLVVPKAAVIEQEAATAKTVDQPRNADKDGRKRIVLTNDDRKQVDRAIRTLTAAGLGIVVMCRGCNSIMQNEGPRGEDAAGYGCKCSRLYFLGGRPNQQFKVGKR